MSGLPYTTIRDAIFGFLGWKAWVHDALFAIGNKNML